MNEREELTEEEAKTAGLVPAENEFDSEEEQTFVESGCHFWNEKQLEPFSAQRQIAANCLGLRFGNLNKDEVEQATSTGSYPDMLQDAVIVLYLCASKIDESYAACDPSMRKSVRRRALDWGAKEGIEMQSEAYIKAAQMMAKIVQEVISNRFKLPKATGRLPSGN